MGNLKASTLLNFFADYLRKKLRLKEKYIPFYKARVHQPYAHCNLSLEQPLSHELVSAFLGKFSQIHPDWQIRQAEDALRQYLYFLQAKQTLTPSLPSSATGGAQWEAALEAMRQALRLKQRSYQTEKTYLSWAESFRQYLKDKPVQQIEEQDIQSFLSYLAVERDVYARD